MKRYGQVSRLKQWMGLVFIVATAWLYAFEVGGEAETASTGDVAEVATVTL